MVSTNTQGIEDSPFSREELYDILHKVCKKYDLQFHIIAGLIERESDWITYRTRYEPEFTYLDEVHVNAVANRISRETELRHQMTSWGLMQIMGGTSRGAGWGGPLVRLCEPEIGIEYGCRYYKAVCSRFPAVDKQIATYNKGSPVYIGGKLANQEYVDAVLGFSKKYEGIV